MENTSNTAATGSTSRSPNAVPHSDSIMMWGAKGSGKSVYIASLVYWSPPADAARRVCVLPANSVAAEWVADRVRALTRLDEREQGTVNREQRLHGGTVPGSPFPVPTPIPEIYKTLVERRLDFRLYTLPTTAGPITRLLNTESRYEASLNFWDVPGEVYDGDIPPNILREMTRARGLILLINPSF